MFKVQYFGKTTLSWWNDQKGNVDLKPVFQRLGKIWKSKDKQFFIDSILNGFDVPKFYVADFRYSNKLPNTSKKSYAVIDGKQRFETIFEFFAGEFELAADFKLYDRPTLKLGGWNYRKLVQEQPDIVKRFSEYEPTVMSIITDEEAKVNELFVRLNRSKPLNGAEILNAMLGKVPVILRKLGQHGFFTSRVKFSRDRYQDRQTAAKLLLLEVRGELVDTKRVQIHALAQAGTESPDGKKKWTKLEKAVALAGYSSDEGLQRASLIVKKNLTVMSRIFKPKDPLLSSQGPVTLYYWFIRKHAADSKKSLRDFLSKMDTARRINETRANNREVDLDEELLQYSRVRRSPNDQASVASALAILERRYEHYRSTGSVEPSLKPAQ